MVRSSTGSFAKVCMGGLATALLVGPFGAVGQAQTPDTPEGTPETTPTEPAEADTTPRFTCQMQNGQYTVMYSPTSQPGQAYPWAVPQDLGSAWPAERRCATISARLEEYRPDGLLALETAVENGYNTVCVTTESTPGCRIVFTVPPGQDATATRDLVFDNLAIADRGDQTQGVTTFAGGNSDVLGQIGNILGLPGSTSSSRSSGINLKPFLDPTDGGTGARLSGGSPAGRPLDPDAFR
ncbi:COP23 domain-containing protein [Leptolyngbya sp. CCNP1308]|uniref:COP23 domain-containing protein n=1 Tax=Leptolyngbya sp. CCNP1308 TaxID=3110255 RepID=UPI002B1FA752|nr:COP23 domain-containing protein [Leptolyngbya sp. CCNP1308]MEA5452717.1 COP23 domain-containing protein [Leptolyngbya sp. CCNP1308]